MGIYETFFGNNEESDKKLSIFSLNQINTNISVKSCSISLLKRFKVDLCTI